MMMKFKLPRPHRAILLSAALHAVLALALVFWARHQPMPQETISMEILENPPPPPAAPSPSDPALVKKKVQIDDTMKVVDQDEKPVNNDVDENAKYLSRNNQRVEKQTVAREHGEFKNHAVNDRKGDKGSAATTPEPEKALAKFLPQFDVAKAVKERDTREQEFDKDAEGLMAAKKAAEAKEVVAKKELGTGDDAAKGSDVSQTLDYIKDLDPGLETMLSSKEFKYYTYFSRLRTQLNQHWAPKVRTKVTQIYRQGRRIASTDDLITRCLVTLDKSGKLIKVQIIGNSGLIELDEAATEAFRSAAPFPNPPSGMIDADGTIKIRWDFILEA